ncbi:PIN domain-containing protein [Pseudomonas rustica]|uniref:DUF4935 domain-containing protein n=1 Tax=Pseudomonas rustica TaxID=2827099 RepID=A0ABS5N382_9PSED|nr:DUF4935 domain-containing protein [Pseudomonas rustica]
MKNIFPGHFRPKKEELNTHWEESIFIVDANVLLNLYRYSEVTRKELEKSIEGVKDKIFIPHQAAKEFLKNRLIVTSGQSKEYETAITTINDLVRKISSKDRHPFIEEIHLTALNELSESIIASLTTQKETLLRKLTDDEILDFIEKIFDGKTGKPFESARIDEILSEGAIRYERSIPPGYKDKAKDSSDDATRKYGDLIVWLQCIDYAKENKRSVIFVTDDKKEDWWQEQAGKTIGPRTELIEEFKKETNKDFWMYSVSSFIKESADRKQQVISDDIFEEIENIREDLEELQRLKDRKSKNEPSIEIFQETHASSETINTGIIEVFLNNDMNYATGSGKFSPPLIGIPNFNVTLIGSPDDASKNIGISYGCGTTKDFNVHMKARGGILSTGSYVFKYEAEYINSQPSEINSINTDTCSV